MATNTSQVSPEAPRRRQEIPDELAEIVARSLQVGASTGACGLLFGATAGIVRGTAPILFSMVSGIQWFGLGSVYYGTRRMAIARHGPEEQATPYQKVEASALGGAIAGATVAGLTRGRKNILPAGVMFSIFGAAGQVAVARWGASSEASREDKSAGWLSKWIPLKKLTDQEYEVILEEKILRVDAEIAIIDEHIADLKAQKQAQAGGSQDSRQPDRKK